MGNILVIDTGSSSMRGILIDEKGKFIENCQINYAMTIVDSETAVQDAKSFGHSLTTICKTIVEKGYGVEALSFTSQRSSVLPVDKDGTPLSEILMWHDKRSSQICDEMNEKALKEIYNTCGMKASPVFSAPKMLWLKRNKREVYDKTYKLMGIHDYLLYLCTGRFLTDTSLASRTCLLDVRKREWSSDMIKRFEIDKEKLCEIIPVGSKAGTVTEEFAKLTGLQAGIPVISAGGDQQCSALGQGLFNRTQAGITSGTASYVVTIVDEPIFDEKCRVNLNVAAEEEKWILEASNMASGAVYRWLKQIMYAKEESFEVMNQEILNSQVGAKGVIMFPDLAGSGCPHWNPLERGMFFNLGFEVERCDMLRSVLEGIGAEVGECFETLTSLVGDVPQVKATGGLANFWVFNQIVADMINHPIESCPIKETTAIGAWASAAKALGLCETIEDALGLVKVEGEDPQSVLPTEEHYELYCKHNKLRHYLRTCIDSLEVSRLLN